MLAGDVSVRSSLARARELILSHGWNSTCYQILNPGIEHWFSAADRGLVGYTRRANVLLVAGAPVCSANALRSVSGEFEEYARTLGCRVCYVCAQDRLRDVLEREAGHAIIALGAQPAWNPQSWNARMRAHRSLRSQVKRSQNKEVRVEALRPEQAGESAELRCVLREWVQNRSLPPLHFLVEPEILDGVLADRVFFVARRGNRCVAFLVASPVAGRRGYLVELLARAHDAPNGTSELLIDAAMRHLAEHKDSYVTLGLVALAHAADHSIRRNPPWLRGLMWFARAHANRFYNFRGLEQFRLKMYPDAWEPVYAISNEPKFSLSTLYAIGAAFAGISPVLALALGLSKAVRKEFENMTHRPPGIAQVR